MITHTAGAPAAAYDFITIFAVSSKEIAAEALEAKAEAASASILFQIHSYVIFTSFQCNVGLIEWVEVVLDWEAYRQAFLF